MKDGRSVKKTIRSDSVEQMVEETVRSDHPATVAELFQTVQKDYPSVTREDVVRVVERLRDDGKLELELPSLRVGTYFQYLAVRSENLWFYSVVAVCVCVLSAVYVIPSGYSTDIFRWIVGYIFLLFLPGFVVMQAMFPGGKDLDGIERFALSVGLSIAVTPLIGLLLNYTPWGIRLDPIMTGLFMFILSIAIIATYRKYREYARND